MIVAVLSIFLSNGIAESSVYLEGRIPPNNGRYKTFQEVLRLMEESGVHTIVETGTERWEEGQSSFDGDGGATIIFSHWASQHDALVYSVDINQTHLAYSIENTRCYVPHIQLVHSDSVTFLETFPTTIDLLYLDSFDYDERNPDPAQQHCLREAMAAEDKLTSSSIIMIDDCNVPGGGKGLLAVRYLCSKGWKIHRNHHQVILLR